MKQQPFSGEVFWWIVAVFLGAIGWGLPAILMVEAPHSTQLILSIAGITVAGGILGYQRPERVWRWGIASVILLPVAEAIRTQSFVYFLIQIPASVVPAVAAFAGAFVGMVLKKGWTASRPGSEDLRRWWAGFVTGLLCSIPYVLPPELERVNIIVTVALLSGLSLVLSVSFPQRVWRWALAAGLSLPAMVFLRTSWDSVTGSGSHNLFGLELILAAAFAFPAAFAGAYVGNLIETIRRAARNKTPKA